MPSHIIKRLLILGTLAIFGIIFIQSYWVLKTWNLKDQEFNQSVMITLRKVAVSLAKFNNSELPKTKLIQRKSSNTYAVNINDYIDANVLEDYLIKEFEEESLNTDFEYAVYDCFTDDLVYGDFCKLSQRIQTKARTESLPKFEDLDYYFVVRFPFRKSFLLSNMQQSILFSAIALLAILFFIYAIFVILRQKRLSELQKDFINNMTHEFKTPISSIKIAADVLGNNDLIQSDNRLKKYAKIIKEQNSRLNEQVGKILNIAKFETGSLELKLEDIELNQTLEFIVSDVKEKIDENAKLNLKLLPGELIIKADKLHFTNLIYNVLDNAEKYCKDYPEITVSADQVNGSIILSIEDKGMGIAQNDQDKIFDKFYRVSTGNVHDVKGFGLGLYYVKNVCEAHKWKIEVNSQIDQGTTVKIKIPNT
jgi:two-component system phosphate regulon sensor histidine kinase PhoR